MNQFGKLIKAGRIAKGLNSEEAARNAGISESYYRAIENGNRGCPRLDVCFHLAQSLDLDPANALWHAIHEQVPLEAQDILTESLDKFLADMTAEAQVLFKKLAQLPDDKRASAYKILEEIFKLSS